MLQRAASNAYSWWWASHVRTKQSKWLDNNLKDLLNNQGKDIYMHEQFLLFLKICTLSIATAFPDQVQYALLEEDDDNLPKAFTTVDPRKIHKSTVEGLLEKQINDMQQEVCYFQEEFNENAAIEDDEARALMTATALKSCEDAIIKFQEQQNTFFSQAITESERVKVSREKLEGVMRGHGKSLSYPRKSTHENVINNVNVKIYELYAINQEKIELQETVDKIKEYFQMNSDVSVEEIAEKIDELVNKVVDLELTISSETAQIYRLCLENNELEKSLQKLEEEKTELANGPGELTDNLKEAEEELIRVENAVRSYHEEERIFYLNFTETINSFCDISYMLQLPIIEHQDVSRCMLTDEATPSIGTEPSGEYDRTNPSENSETDEAARNPQMDGSPEHYDIPETATLPNGSPSSSVNNDLKAEKHCQLEKTDDLCCWKLEDKSTILVVITCSWFAHPTLVHCSGCAETTCSSLLARAELVTRSPEMCPTDCCNREIGPRPQPQCDAHPTPPAQGHGR